MGTSKKSQVGKGFKNDGEKWVFAEISIRASLKPVKTKLRKPERESEAEEEEKDYNGIEEFCITPTKKGAKTLEKLKCPAAPKKRRPALKCRSNAGRYEKKKNYRDMKRSDIIKLLGCLLLILAFSVSVSAGEFQRRVSANNETIVSPGNVFELGLFRDEHLINNWYLGIWYKNDPKHTPVWVANRDKHFNISTGTLMFSDDLFLFKQNNRSVWWTNLTQVNLTSHLVAELLDNGNFVVKDASNRNNDPDGFLWQSFDTPTDTLLPEMKLGRDPKAKKERILTSWNPNDDWSVSLELYKKRAGLIELSMWQQQQVCIYRSEPWDGNHFVGIPLDFKLWENVGDSNFAFLMIGHNNSRLTLRRDSLYLFTWKPKTIERKLVLSISENCNTYQLCGPNGLCSPNTTSPCNCIQGFEPVSPFRWSTEEWSDGCRRKTLLNCTGDLFFLHLKNVKLPDTKSSPGIIKAIGKEECEKRCRGNCECTAYAYVDILYGQPAACAIWSEELIDIRNYSVGGRDLYVKLAATDQKDKTTTPTTTRDGRFSSLQITLIIVGVVIAAATFIGFYFWKRHKRITTHGPTETIITNEIAGQDKFQFMEFEAVAEATNNFSEANILGEGGFGVVYKGTLTNGHEVAVKRLSISSSQGAKEFKNEVKIILNVLHINLVRLLGCCHQGQEKLLVYEFLENSSLNKYLFDEAQSWGLNWEKRHVIIKGIIEGLLYLHRYASPPIIHRDLKPSNILLAKGMIPKISDFGLAKILEREETKTETDKAVGTRGYMSEEYAMNGIMSAKSDIFSFGVTLLEIITGKRNTEYCHLHRGDSLLDYVWEHWSQGNGVHLVDSNYVDSSMVEVEEEVLRCIQIGLMCVQENVDDRPTTEAVALMLATTTMEIPQPAKPNYFYAKFLGGTASEPTNITQSGTINQATLSVIHGR